MFTRKNFSFYSNRLCFVTICLKRQALTSIFESAVLCAFITAHIPMKWFHSRDETNSLIRLKHISIHSVKQGESFKPHSKAIGHTSALQRVFFLILVNNFLSRTREPLHYPVKTGSQLLLLLLLLLLLCKSLKECVAQIHIQLHIVM